MSTNKKRVPGLRFEGFRGEWKEKYLSEISNKVLEKNLENQVSETLTNSAEYGIISQKDYFDKEISNKNNTCNYYIVNQNDFVYNPRISSLAPVGPIHRNKLNRVGIVSPLYYVFRTYGVDVLYLEKYFTSNLWHYFMKENGDSGARSDRISIKDSIFNKLPIPHPSLQEQTLIGNFFKQLDEVIQLLEEELTKYKNLKKAYLAKMFPKEGEKVPELRFPGFSGEWEEKKLGSIASVDRGLTYTPADTRGVGVRVLRSSNIDVDRLVIRDDDVFVDPNCINIEFVNLGDIIITAANGSTHLVGKHALVNKRIEKSVHGGFMLLVRVTNSEFVNSWMGTNDYKGMLNLVQGGNGAIGNLSKKLLEELVIKIPHREEQATIGNFFKELDQTIELKAQELEKYRDLKKAYLVKMFV